MPLTVTGGEAGARTALLKAAVEELRVELGEQGIGFRELA